MEATLDITKLTPVQLQALTKQMTAMRKAKSGDAGKRNKVIDAMLQEKNGTEFKHTTGDILGKLQSENIVSKSLTSDERAGELKKIQTRKQLLDKKPEFKGKVGYKVSAAGFAVTLDRVLTFIATCNATDRAAIAKAAK